jgi:hypothetical protein
MLKGLLYKRTVDHPITGAQKEYHFKTNDVLIDFNNVPPQNLAVLNSHAVSIDHCVSIIDRNANTTLKEMFEFSARIVNHLFDIETLMAISNPV